LKRRRQAVMCVSWVINHEIFQQVFAVILICLGDCT
jgi:hypothetical protein